MKSETATELKQLLEISISELERITTEQNDLLSRKERVTEKIKALRILLGGNASDPVVKPRGASLLAAAVPVNQFIADFIAGKKTDGATRKEIADALKQGGYDNHPNYPYVVVTQLKEAGKVVEPEKGKLFWLEPR